MTVNDLLSLPVTTLSGEERTFGDIAGGRVTLVVNVASRCGLTPQYAKLEELQQRYRDRGFAVIGFPCNQFMGQEPGSNQEIAEFCSTNYGVTFPMSAKTQVNGPDRDPVYAVLVAAGGPADIRWNFEKFLVAPDGRVLDRFAPQVEPDAPELLGSLERALTA